jgi:hypothetical protein
MLRHFPFLKLLALVIASLLQGATAHAALEMKLSDGTSTVTIADGSGSDSNPAAGAVTWIGSLGVWLVNVSTGAGSAALGPGQLELNGTNTSTDAGTLTILFSETDLAAPSGSWNVQWGGTISGGTVSASAYESNTNALYDTQTTLASFGPYSGPAFSSSAVAATPGATAPYSLTERIDITACTAASYSGDLHVEAVPEPTMLAAWALFGVAGLAFRYGRRVSAIG